MERRSRARRTKTKKAMMSPRAPTIGWSPTITSRRKSDWPQRAKVN
jgi:hypothetical protein